MCGLAGYANILKTNFELDLSLLHAMQEKISHRGPDGFRTWHSDHHHVGFVHRRLSIMDLSDKAFQPMMSRDQSIIVCCNGEIYNHPQLRVELEQKGYVYQTHSDTETIIYAYQEWGMKFLDHLEGMFAIILFDTTKNELFLIRDRMGIKPLYFSLEGNVLSFASEIKALWQLPWMSKKLKSQALYHYLTFLVTPAPMTLYQGVYKLPAGFFLHLDARKNVSFHEWYNPARTAHSYPLDLYRDEQTVIKTLQTLLRTSVQKHLMSDVPLGVFLSGGIDSSLLVALMSEITTRPVNTFSIFFSDGPEMHEKLWVNMITERFNTNHHEIMITEKEAYDFFESMVYYQDEPLADSVCVPLYYVSRLARECNVPVVSVGEGADELFCGYNYYAQHLSIAPYWHYSQRFIPQALRYGAHKLSSWALNESHNDLIAAWAQGHHSFWSGTILFGENWKQSIMSSDFSEPIDAIVAQIYPQLQQINDSYTIPQYHLSQLFKQLPAADTMTAITYLELKNRLPELLLMRVDKMSMINAIEARVPFLDHQLVEYALHMPQNLKYNNGITKYILKKAAEGIIPHEIIYRKKMGFAAPVTRWFKDGTYFRPAFQDLLNSKKGDLFEHFNKNSLEALLKNNTGSNYDYSYHLWALMNAMSLEL